MHKIVIYLFLLFTTSLMASEIHWAKDLNSAMLSAQKENKPVMFVISRHTCKYCVILENTTFSDAKVIDDLNKNFITAIAYTDDGDYIPRALWQPGTPATWFLAPSGEPMYQAVVGAIGPESFLGGLQSVKAKFNTIKSGK